MIDADPQYRLRRSIIGALVDGDEGAGMSLAVLSAWIGVEEDTIEPVLGSMVEHDEAELVRFRGYKVVPTRWSLTDAGHRGYRDPRFAVMQRKCLCCSEQFESQHAGNRICERCTTREFDDGPSLDDLGLRLSVA